MSMKNALFLLLFLSIFMPLPHKASGALPEFRIQAEAEPDGLRPGEEGRIRIQIEIPEGFHLADPSEGLLSVTPESVPEMAFDAPRYPKATKDRWGLVYRGRIGITLPFRVLSVSEPGDRLVRFFVLYQPCDERQEVCYPPQTDTTTVRIRLLDSSGVTSASQGTGLAERLSWALERGSLFSFLLVFLGGILTSLTPCVYPMIPITLAVIGAQAGSGKGRGFILSLFYVLGISLTFSTLGVVAAQTGSLFGAFAQHPAVQAGVSLVFFAMGLSMLGLFVIQPPAALRMRMATRRHAGLWGALLTGMVSGLLVSPCVGPLLVVLLTWVARTGSVTLGFGLLFTFAWGLGILLIAIGTFSGALRSLPKAGGWTESIERIFGLILIGLAISFARPLMSFFIHRLAWAFFWIFCGTLAGGVSPLPSDASLKGRLAKALGMFLILLGGALLIDGVFRWSGSRGVSMPTVSKTGEPIRSVASPPGWLTDEETAFALAQETRRFLLIDFYADWCAACRELDERTWSDPRVQGALARTVPLRLDLTRPGPQAQAFYRRYGVIGLPTVILWSPEKGEIRRFEGFLPPEEVLRFLEGGERQP